MNDRGYKSNTYSYNDQLDNEAGNENQEGVMDSIGETIQNAINKVTDNDQNNTQS
ncbi:hypothetical protein [Heyndrickxia acidiproducens]|uniref:hypothetical protein n=1 Tax=Heyndrickxia acidiproducens TaxID=1121084 RepID=UPI0003647832|nr:hypothetical protein [Heyndrickxia acidiproducens]